MGSTSNDHTTTTINISKSTSIPSIIISTQGLKNPTHMMIDTGAARNLIKQKVLNPEVPINSQNVLKLTEINDLPLYRLGQVKINIFGYPTIFNIIPNEVPVEEDGLLGSEFFQDNSGNINYTSKCLEIENHCYPFKSTNKFTIPARTVTTFYINIKNTEKSEGYVPRLHIQDGVYIGDAVVKNRKGKAYLKFANTNEIPITLSVPIVN